MERGGRDGYKRETRHKTQDTRHKTQDIYNINPSTRIPGKKIKIKMTSRHFFTHPEQASPHSGHLCRNTKMRKIFVSNKSERLKGAKNIIRETCLELERLKNLPVFGPLVLFF